MHGSTLSLQFMSICLPALPGNVYCDSRFNAQKCLTAMGISRSEVQYRCTKVLVRFFYHFLIIAFKGIRWRTLSVFIALEVFRFKFVMDFVFLVVPVLLVMTIFSQSLLLLACVLTTCLVTLLLFIVCEYLISPDRPAMRVVMNKLIDESQQPTTFVTYFRWVEEFNSSFLISR